MKNQHKKISGYRDLFKEEIDTINKVKAHGEQLKELLDELDNTESTDKRWVGIARTQLQQGISAAVRSIAKPEGF